MKAEGAYYWNGNNNYGIALEVLKLGWRLRTRILEIIRSIIKDFSSD